MTTKPKIALIIGSTRETRFADKPAAWMLAQAQKRDDMDVELVDLRDFDLPLFDEAASNLWMPSSDERAVKWQQKIGEFDGYIFCCRRIQPFNHRCAEERIGSGLQRMEPQADVGNCLWFRRRHTGAGTPAQYRCGIADGPDTQRRAYRRRRFLCGSPAGVQQRD